MDFLSVKEKVIREIENTLQKIEKEKVEILIEAILSAEKVFVIGVGRVMLMMEAFAKRLRHLGIDAHVVGEIIEPPATKKDLLIVASGSGESIFPAGISEKARKIGMKIILITARRNSKITKISDSIILIPAPTKLDSYKGKKSFQPLGNLFEQGLLIFCDIAAMLIQQRLGLEGESLQKHHANLE